MGDGAKRKTFLTFRVQYWIERIIIIPMREKERKRPRYNYLITSRLVEATSEAAFS